MQCNAVQCNVMYVCTHALMQSDVTFFLACLGTHQLVLMMSVICMRRAVFFVLFSRFLLIASLMSLFLQLKLERPRTLYFSAVTICCYRDPCIV